MRASAVFAFLVVFLAGSSDAAVVSGGGEALVVQGPDASSSTRVDARVRMVGAWATGIAGRGELLVRFQFVRPDARAVSFLIINLPDTAPLSGLFVPSTPGVSLSYYEVFPDSPEEPLFVADEWDGEVLASEPAAAGHDDLTLGLKVKLVDQGPDGVSGSEDDQVRTIYAERLRMAVRGSFQAPSYTYVDDDVYVTGDAVVILSDGCGGDPGYDDYYYDDPYYDENYDEESEYYTDVDSSSCDGDSYDDSSNESDWSDSGDSSCSADDDYGDSGDSGGSGCEGDDWEASKGGVGGATLGPKKPWGKKKPRSPWKMAPLLLVLLGWAGLKVATRYVRVVGRAV